MASMKVAALLLYRPAFRAARLRKTTVQRCYVDRSPHAARTYSVHETDTYKRSAISLIALFLARSFLSRARNRGLYSHSTVLYTKY